MNTAKSLGVLAAAAAVLAGAALLLTSRPGGGAAADAGPMLPGLADRVNDIDRITVQQGDRRAEYTRTGDGWVAASAGGHPVRFEDVKSALVGLAALERSEPRTNDPARHDKLDLDWPDPDGRARRVTLVAGADQLVEVVLGKRVGAGDGVYARLAGQDQTYRCAGDAPVEADATRWMDRVFCQVPPGGLSTIETERLVLTRDGDAWTTEPGPGGGVADDLANRARGRLTTMLARLEFDDIRQRDAEPPANPFEIAFRSDDGGALMRLDLGEAGDPAWLTLDALPAPEGPAPAPNDDDGPDAAARWFERPEWARWAYQIPSWRVEVLRELAAAGPPAEPPADTEAAAPEPAVPPPAPGDG